MIRTCKDADTENVWNRRYVKKFGLDLTRSAYKKLSILNAATAINDLRVPPGNRLEKLSGDREGQHSIRINDQWRICFEWTDGDAENVEIVDYH